MTREDAIEFARTVASEGLYYASNFGEYAAAMVLLYRLLEEVRPDLVSSACNPENSPVDERKTDEGIISRIEELERQIGCINARIENHSAWLGDLQEKCSSLKERMDNAAVWHKDVDVAQEELEKRIDDLYNTRERWVTLLDRLANRIEALEEWRRG